MSSDRTEVCSNCGEDMVFDGFYLVKGLDPRIAVYKCTRCKRKLYVVKEKHWNPACGWVPKEVEL